MDLRCISKGSGLIIRKIPLRKSGHALEQDAQEDGRVTAPRGVQEKSKGVTEGQGLVGVVGMG